MERVAAIPTRASPSPGARGERSVLWLFLQQAALSFSRRGMMLVSSSHAALNKAIQFALLPPPPSPPSPPPAADAGAAQAKE
eukprot:527304-Prorocentrum_minimum.AAC.1